MTCRSVVVVGGGVAGLAAAIALRRADPGLDVVVLEEQARVGGLVQTERTAGGFLVERGADCLLTTKPHGVAAAHAAGLADQIVAPLSPRRSYLARGDRLVPLPMLLAGLGPAVSSLLRTPLLTVAGKARAACEPLVRPRRETDDESVRSFAVRRFGTELATTVLDPLMNGLYGEDTDRLSVESCLPELRRFERDHGSVTAGVQRAIRARRRRGRAGEAMLPPVVSLRNGMGALSEALGRGLATAVTTGVAVRRVTRHPRGRFGVETERGTITCDGVVLATPAWRTSSLVADLSTDLAAGLAEVAYRTLDCVTLAWRRRDVPHPLDGTGWVRAAGDRRPTLACTWATEKWPNRAPAGYTLVRSVLSLPDGDDEELVAAACADLRDLVGVTTASVLTHTSRLPRATPLYAVGHGETVARLAAEVRNLGALALAGSAYRGIGVPACVMSGEDAARSVLDALVA